MATQTATFTVGGRMKWHRGIPALVLAAVVAVGLLTRERPAAAFSRGSTFQRVQNTTGATTIKTGAGTLKAIVLASTDAAVANLTVTINGSTAIVLRVPATASPSLTIPFGTEGLFFTTSLAVTPSALGVDALVVYE
jgi:hypothetical protein